MRVFLDPEKVENWPEIRDWFFKKKTRKEQDPNRLRDEIIEAGPEILTCQRVVVESAFLGKKGKGAIAKCPSCNEAYPVKDGAACLACQGGSPYRSSLLTDPTEVKPNLRIITGD